MDAISYSLAAKAIKGLENKVDLNGNAVSIPVGGNADRPVLSSDERAIRFNTDVGGLEEWNGVEWKNISADISVVSIKGTDTEENILTLVGMDSGDIWIASDTLDGWMYDGIEWLNLGPLKGEKGDQGVQGIQGIQGIQGEKGETGDKGEKGDTGDKGDTGTGLTVKGADTEANILSSVGVEGDFWIGLDTGNGYSYVDGLWVNTGQIRGPQGLQGEQGEKGDTGKGLTVKGTDTEVNILAKVGLEGDFWIGSDTGNGYSYVEGSWVDTGQVRGPKGDTGDTGLTGTTGDKGDKGDKGDTGDAGNGIVSVVRTSGTGAPGTTDTFTITYTDTTTSTFNVYNGQDGIGAINDNTMSDTTLWSSNKIASELDALDAFPEQSGNEGKVLSTDGTNAEWITVKTKPTQAYLMAYAI